MKTLAITLSLFLCIVSCTNSPKTSKSSISVYTDQLDIRELSWGASPSLVKATETWSLVNNNTNDLTYESILNDLHCSLVYKFSSGLLSEVYYSFRDDTLYTLKDFNKLRSILIEKYGKQTVGDSIYNTNKKEFAAGWENPRTRILLYYFHNVLNEPTMYLSYKATDKMMQYVLIYDSILKDMKKKEEIDKTF